MFVSNYEKIKTFLFNSCRCNTHRCSWYTFIPFSKWHSRYVWRTNPLLRRTTMTDVLSSLLKSESLNALVQNQHSHVSIGHYTGDEIFSNGPDRSPGTVYISDLTDVRIPPDQTFPSVLINEMNVLHKSFSMEFDPATEKPMSERMNFTARSQSSRASGCFWAESRTADYSKATCNLTFDFADDERNEFSNARTWDE